jgi:hypothetical protein
MSKLAKRKGFQSAAYIGAITSYFTPGIWNFTWPANSLQILSDGANSETVMDSNNPITNYYLNLGISGGQYNSNLTVQWARGRTYPPNDIMPSKCTGRSS